MNKLLCISHSSLNAGAERAFFEMVKALQIAGYKIYCIFPADGPLIKLCEPYIIQYSIIDLPWWFGYKLNLKKRLFLILKILRSSLLIRKYILQINVDAVIVNTIAIPSGAIGALFSKKKVYWFLHELANDGFTLIFGENFTKKLIGKLSHRIICNSQFIASHYSHFINPVKIKVAYQSVEINILKKSNTESNTVIFGIIGRISEQKQQKEALLAALKLITSNFKLWLIGADNNPYATELKQWVNENKLSYRISFLGETDKIEEIYSKLDVLITCSINEALGRTTIEAMKFSLPVIAPNASGHREIITDNYNGLFYESGNPADLADKMNKLLIKTKRKEMGENACIWANENFNSGRFGKMLIESLNW